MLKSMLLAGAVAFSMAGAALAADGAPRPVTTYHAPRSADGHASLEGTWTNSSLTRLERNPRYGKSLILTEDEAKAAEGRNAKVLEVAAKPTDPNATVIDLP